MLIERYKCKLYKKNLIIRLLLLYSIAITILAILLVILRILNNA